MFVWRSANPHWSMGVNSSPQAWKVDQWPIDKLNYKVAIESSGPMTSREPLLLWCRSPGLWNVAVFILFIHNSKVAVEYSVETAAAVSCFGGVVGTRRRTALCPSQDRRSQLRFAHKAISTWLAAKHGRHTCCQRTQARGSESLTSSSKLGYNRTVSNQRGRLLAYRFCGSACRK